MTANQYKHIHTLTFLGENTPTVSPSSLNATPISANTASLKAKNTLNTFKHTNIICAVMLMHNLNFF